MEWLSSYRPFRVVETPGEGQPARRVEFLVGSPREMEPVEAHWDAPLSADRVYLAHPTGALLLDLSPFVQLGKPGDPEAAVLVISDAPGMKRVRLDDCAGGDAQVIGIPGFPADTAFDAWLANRSEHVLAHPNAGGAAAFAVERPGAGGSAAPAMGGRWLVQVGLLALGILILFALWSLFRG